jgi:hypothetical protein
MSFASQASKLLTNKYFLYFMVFLAASNVLGYLVTNKVHAVIFFALIGFLMSNFSKNMAVVLLVAIVATNLLMANKTMREGLENATTTEKVDTQAVKEKVSTVDKEKLESVDPQLSNGLNALEETGSVEKAKEKLKQATTAMSESETKIKDINNPDMNKEVDEIGAPEAKKSGFHNIKKGSVSSNAAPVDENNSRIDYASTLEGAYDNLDKILGSDGINKLTGDTQKLMAQQQKLFDTMQNMAPMLEDAKKMLAGFDMKELGNLAGLATSIGTTATPIQK